MADLGFEIGEATALKPSAPRKWLRPALMFSVPALLLAGGGYYYVANAHYESTDNAYISQDKVTLSPEVTGRIIEVAVRENAHVDKGDVLFRLDPEPYRIALRKADAALAAARVSVVGLEADVTGAGVDITSARSEVEFASNEFERQTELLKRGFTTRARYQQAQLDLSKAREKLNAALTDAGKARSALGSGGSASGAPAAIEAAIAEREQAALNLQRTEVRAPVSGIVSQTDRLQVGSTLPTGLPALSVVADGAAWVEANFKETELRRMRPGQPATIKIDAYDMKLRGHVASIGAGTGSEFALLPAQNANGNWVKVTQRVPVRIAFDESADRSMIAGLSVTVRVDTADGGR